MRKLFDIDNPIMQFLSRVGDLIILNFLFLACSVPVVTIGASIAGMIKACQGYIGERGPGTVKSFFQGFKNNFKQATIAWLVLLVAVTGMVCNLLLINTYLTGSLATAARVLAGLIIAVLLGVGAFLFPLIVRYENTLPEHCRNAAILAVAKLPRTLAMIFLELIPVIVFFLSLEIFFKTISFWVLIGFAVVCYADCELLSPVLRQLEKPKSGGEETQTDEDEEEEEEA